MFWRFHLVSRNSIFDRKTFFDDLGGVREALFGDHNYHLIWKERKGFAKVAIDAKTVSSMFIIDAELPSFFQAIIPMFTKNSREAIRAMSIGRRKSVQILSFLSYSHDCSRISTIHLRTNSITISAYLRNLSSENDVRLFLSSLPSR